MNISDYIQNHAELILDNIKKLTHQLKYGILVSEELLLVDDIPNILGTYWSFKDKNNPIQAVYFTRRIDMLKYFQSKKGLIFAENKFLSKYEREIEFLGANTIVIDLVKMMQDEDFNTSFFPIIVCRHWYLMLQFEKVRPTYRIKQYTIEQIISELVKQEV